MAGPDDGSSDAALTGIVDDERWMRDVVELRDGLRAVHGLSGEPVALLRGLGSPALAAATGLLLRSAGRRTPAVLDGPGAATAALLARGQAWECSDWWQVAPVRAETLTDRVVAGLQLTPLSGMAVPVEDGTAALLAADVLCAAAALLTLPSATAPFTRRAPGVRRVRSGALGDGARLAAGTLTVLRVPAPRLVDRAAAAVAMTLAPVAGRCSPCPRPPSARSP